jgi:superfamily II DNA or RNA helicase
MERFVEAAPLAPDESLEFRELTWADCKIRARGTFNSHRIEVVLRFATSSAMVTPSCTLCGSGRFCAHACELLLLLRDAGIAKEIEENDFRPCSYTLIKKKKQKSTSPWKSQLNQLAQQLNYVSPPAEPAPARFPPGREAIYVIQQDRYGNSSDSALSIQVSTRPIGGDQEQFRKSENKFFKNFNAGVRGLAASGDPLDREIADKISLTSDAYDYYEPRQQINFSIPFDTGAELIARLARSGRLYHNKTYFLHNDLDQLNWLGDDRFELKFEIKADDADELSLGACAVSAQHTISQKEFKFISTCFFIDKKNHMGLFNRPISSGVSDSLKTADRIRVPKQHAAELIEKVMELPAGLGIHFVNCDEIRPRRIDCSPRPRIHLKAPASPLDERLIATVHFDYDGILIPLSRRIAEFYDKTRSAVVTIDQAFHDRSMEFLASIGLKVVQSYQQVNFVLQKKKLPRTVAQLIHHGWHVEADGKLYRAGSRFDLNIVSDIDWFELQGKAHFDQTSIDLPKLIQSLRAGERSVVLDDGSIGVIPEAWIKQFGSLAELSSTEDGAIKFGRSQVGLLDALLAQQGAVNVDEQFAAARQSLREFDRIAPQAPPAGFVGTLRPYQQLAQGWFEFLRNLGFGGCLADDMGLGKTVQVLSLLEQRRALGSGPSLIVVPRSLVFNWTAEAAKFAPKLRVLDQSHSQRVRGTEHLTDFDLVLTTYGTLRRDAAFLKDFEFDYVILDEAQAIKNATTEASKAARLLKGKHKLALSGTPIENHLGELWSLFDFLNPGMLGRVGRFACLAHDADADQRNLLAAAVRPFILRRTKKQVAPELPDRVEQTIVVELDGEERKAYNELRDYYRQKLLNKIDTDGIGKSQIVILEALLRLRQAACHPGLIDKARVNEPSAKLEELLARLTSAAESSERVLVFSQFTSLLAIVKKRLKQAGIDFLYLDGKTKNRQELVEQFQSGDGPAVFLISLKAGGVGLNLTAARTVYLLDPWWNPAVEAQAIDRAHRIGQQQTVFATRLITADTVEQKVLELQAKKKGLADAIVNADNAGISSLTREDLELLLA